jgi:hypothetical protein
MAAVSDPPFEATQMGDEDAFTVYKRSAADRTSLRTAGDLTEVRPVEWIPEGKRVCEQNHVDKMYILTLFPLRFSRCLLQPMHWACVGKCRM